MTGGILGPKAIAQLRADHKKLSRLRPTQGQSSGTYLNTPNGSLIVKLEEDIAADDYEFHDAKSMKLDDGEWVECDVPAVKVRSPLDIAFGEGTRHIATLVANLGLCIGLGPSFVWGQLGTASGKDDAMLQVTLYASAREAEFVATTSGATCDAGGSGSGGSGSGSGSGGGGNDFTDMDFDLCGVGESVLALVPAGFKAGPVGLALWPTGGTGCEVDSGSGSGSGPQWKGWVVLVGRRERTKLKIPTAIACCPIEGLKFTAFDMPWVFGGGGDSCADPCDAGSGS